VLRRFVQNTAISAVAYALAGVLGLFAVGLIAKSYGLAVLGLIVLSRAFLPTGFLALLDLGVSETTTQAVAKGRVGDWVVAGEKVSLLAVIAAAVGIASGVILWSVAVQLTAIFKVAPDQAAAFAAILRVTALALPIVFLGLIAEGTLKGFEQYGWLRLTEVGGNVLYVAAVYILAWRGAPFEWIAYSYLAVIMAKYFVLAGIVCSAASETSLRLRSWTAPSRKDVLHRCWLMFNSRIVGTFQQPLVPLAIGALYSPVEVGAFDLITRLARFLKATMGPLHSAILPISTHLDEATDTRRLQILGRNGLVLPAAIIVPILIVVALFSEEILKVWVGSQHSSQWPWLALSMLVPAATVMLGAGQTALIVRSDFLRFNTRLLYLQVTLQYLITALTLVWFRERAFILGWVLSYVVFAPLVADHMLLHMKLPRSLFWQQIGRHLLVGAILTGLVAVTKMFFDPGTLISLVIVGGLSCIVAWALSGAIILTGSDWAMFGRFARAIGPRS
jgi:O-antigen/teichoic acid export membrane protein